MKQIDSIQPPVRRGHLSHEQPPRATGARFTAFTKTPRRRVAWGTVLLVVLSPLLFGLAIAGRLGMGLLVLYGMVAWWRRWPSRISFGLALAALIYMVVLQMAAAADMAQSMAALAYTLLAIGTISLAIEIKMRSRVWFKKH